MLLDDQATALGLLRSDYGLVRVVMPGLLRRNAEAFLAQFAAEVIEPGAVVAFLVAD